MVYIVANIILHIINFTVFYLFAGPEWLKWALVFSVIVQLVPSKTIFINRNSVYCAGVTLLLLHFGVDPMMAFVIGGVLSIAPFVMLGIVPTMVSPSNILPAMFCVLLSFTGMNPIHIYMFSSFVVAKIWILIFANTKFLQWRALRKNYDLKKNLGQRENYR